MYVVPVLNWMTFPSRIAVLFDSFCVEYARWSHVWLNSYFTGTDEARKATNIVTIYKSYEEVPQIFIQYCFQGG